MAVDGINCSGGGKRRLKRRAENWSLTPKIDRATFFISQILMRQRA